jgi:hypothetical protein
MAGGRIAFASGVLRLVGWCGVGSERARDVSRGGSDPGRVAAGFCDPRAGIARVRVQKLGVGGGPVPTTPAPHVHARCHGRFPLLLSTMSTESPGHSLSCKVASVRTIVLKQIRYY